MSIELQNLVKSFNNFDAVKGVNIEIADGEFFVLLGPSGCGKTTTLRMIAGLEKPTSGKVTIHGRDVTDEPPRKRDIAMAFQDYGLYPHMTARQNISFPLKLRRVDKQEINRRVEETADRMGLALLLDKRPAHLSGGERQRVSLARALIRNPGVFLMDEPLSNLDAKLRTVMRTEIKKLVTNLGITTVYVTHDQTEAMAMGDRIAIMNAGAVEQIGAPLEVYDYPNSRFVARFIGSPPMNIFSATISTDGRVSAKDLALSELFSELEPEKSKDGVDLSLGVRPECVHLVAPDDVDSQAKGVVEHVEPLGQDTYVYIRIGSSNMIIVTQRTQFKAGETVGLRADKADLRLLSK